MCICSRTLQCKTVLQNRQHLQRNDIMEYTPQDLLHQDAKSLRSYSGNRVQMHLKGHLGIKCNSQYIKAIRLLQHSSANSKYGWQEMNCAWPGDYYSLSLTRIQFNSQKVKPLTTLPRSRIIDSATVILKHGDGTTAINADICRQPSMLIYADSHQCWWCTDRRTYQLIFQNGKKLRSVKDRGTIGR